MHFEVTRIPGVWIVTPDVFSDERGEFVRTWVPDEFSARGLETRIAQASSALTKQRGVSGGLHYQAPHRGRNDPAGRAPSSTWRSTSLGRPTYQQWCGASFRSMPDDVPPSGAPRYRRSKTTPNWSISSRGYRRRTRGSALGSRVRIVAYRPPTCINAGCRLSRIRAGRS